MKEAVNKKYWETEYTDLLNGVTFRFKKIPAVEHINLVTQNVDFEDMPSEKANVFINHCLSMVMWTRDKETWTELIDKNGNSKLPEVNENMSIILDLFYYFKKDVLAPVFIESKTYQRAISQQGKSQEQKTSAEQ